ncbi:putative transcriptional regulator [Candidatus Regiella insecticola 5.15]|uniref:Putative transcriptional regulator n=1 Tax=Candidatus Regiella insecticola 5.15 TaxID=1005043 RepID=G2GZZ0_9ENTR|nr:S24 family peptidase [Candidatus Regiella insecticola]EGY28690.1 putative transcriptional regulator [Candidatus Regiella insecticola 5.15]
MDFSARLSLAMKQAGYTQGSLAKAVGMAQSSVWRLASGGGASSKKLFQIARILGINPLWLAEGRGDMQSTLGVDVPLSISNSAAYYAPKEQAKKEVYPLKIYNRIEWVLSPGVGDEKDFEPMFWLPKIVVVKAQASIDDSIVIEAQDDSMSPTINEKDMVTVDTSSKSIKNGKIYAVSFGGIGMFRTLFVLPEEKIRLKSNNQTDYPDIIAPIKELTIIGKVYYVAGIID